MKFSKKNVIESARKMSGETRSKIPTIFFDHENFVTYEKIFSNISIIDCHTHIGSDKDGHYAGEKQFIAQMQKSQINKAIVFPLNEPSHKNFSEPNKRVFKFYKSNPEMIVPFFRLDPRSKWKEEYNKRVLEGFRGIKLHPRSQRFEIGSENAMKIYEKAERNGMPVIIHTGFGLSNISADIKLVSESFPKLKLILGHAAFVDFENTFTAVKNNHNIMFDTSTLSIFDLLNLLNTVDYSRIVFGSDVPYYDFGIALEMIVDTAIICNKNPNQIKSILGGNISKWLN